MHTYLNKQQEIIGFGGAFTEASAHNFFQLDTKARTQLLEAYFGAEGIGFSLGRLHINSCDFSLESYSFDDVPEDYEVSHFFVLPPPVMGLRDD